MLKLFRIAAILEGISYLLIFGITMPLKYLASMSGPNIIVGYIHGFLFMAFIAIAAIVCYEQKWGLKRFMIFFIASLLPFGTFYIDKKYLRQEVSYNRK